MSNLKIFNSLTNKKEPFIPIDKSNVRIYACGPTVYNYAHIGNARMAVVFDTVVKFLRYLFPKVTYVSNITDIDDKIIKRSFEENKSCEQISKFYLNIYNNEMRQLNVDKPDFQPKATEYVDSMISKIKSLEDQGNAYLSQKHLLFSVKDFPKYGILSKRNKEQQIAGSRIEIASYKKNPEDFVLWKPSNKNEPGWDSPWGIGRPGWHTECFAMASDLLKTPFDIHGGGLDLKFPHHDNEIAQGCCFQQKKNDESSYAKYWMHNGFVTFKDKKMSKSLGNIILLKDYLKKYNGEIIRFSLLSSHYRSPLIWTERLILQSIKTLNKFYKVLLELENVNLDEEKNKLPDEIEKYFFDDFNLAKVFAYLNLIIKNKNNSFDKKEIKTTLLSVGKILGIFRCDPNDWFKKEINTKNIDIKIIESLINERNLARIEKKYILADEIRMKIHDLGVEIKDTPDGVEWDWIKKQ